ncbi:MAG TPA: ABC transporter permease [Pseudobdellovibrionaceae bacterium]|nr:ABC transporter permease [Pseudobdellovibrionaceae bacterium]
MKALTKKLIQDLKSMMAQTLTIAVLIIGGVSVLVSSWSSYESLLSAMESFYDNYHFAHLFAETTRAPESVAARLASIDGVQIVNTRIVKDGQIIVPTQREPAVGRFISVETGQSLNILYLRKGRMPHKANQLEIVLHEAFATAHKIDVGQVLTIRIGGVMRRTEVVGIGLSPEYVYSLGPAASLPDDLHFGIGWLNRGELASMTGMDGVFNSVVMQADTRSSWNLIKSKIDFLLKPYGGLDSYDREHQLSHLFVSDEIRQQKIMAYVMPGIFLAVAIYILNVVITRTIELQRSQIATMKSLGYSSYQLSLFYFALTTAMVTVGLMPALGAGVWLGKWYAKIYKDYFRFPDIQFQVSPVVYFAAILVVLVPSWLAAAASLQRVFKLNPAEALRPPSPVSYQNQLIEKVWGRFNLEIYTKMILRSLFFRPWRFVLSVIGVAAAMAILINGSFWIDVIDFMMDQQFQKMRREDVEVAFVQPQRNQVISELQGIKGVLLVEGERRLPVKLKYSHFNKEVLLIGRSANSQMSRTLDRFGNIHIPQPGTVILSRYFESLMNIKVGDQIALQMIEGSQREVTVRVQSFVDDLIGQQIYALKNDVHQWFDEAPVMNRVTLKIDGLKNDDVYLELRDRPNVASVGVRKQVVESFHRTVAEMILTFTFVLYFFAAAIAMAVLYNLSRVSFSERSWELASLRILGIRIRDTFEVLFIDIGLQVLISLVPGFALGYYLCFLSTDLIHNDTLKFPMVFDIKTYAGAGIVIICILILSGYLMYLKVRKLDLSEALKARE